MNKKYRPAMAGASAPADPLLVAAERPQGAAIAPDLVVDFAPGVDQLTPGQAGAVSRWVGGWLKREPDAMVVMACAAPETRSARVARLRTLRGLVARHGLAEEQVRYTGDRVAAPGAVPGQAGIALLKVVSARRLGCQVRSIRSFFGADRASEELACTSAS